ncbi:hypothetical protein BC940DRAFT_313191 [Gongronella butleri]|nr:hypothetical protein BC940DRAFT_313191 [Gongronella butleri]
MHFLHSLIPYFLSFFIASVKLNNQIQTIPCCEEKLLSLDELVHHIHGVYQGINVTQYDMFMDGHPLKDNHQLLLQVLRKNKHAQVVLSPKKSSAHATDAIPVIKPTVRRWSAHPEVLPRSPPSMSPSPSQESAASSTSPSSRKDSGISIYDQQKRDAKRPLGADEGNQADGKRPAAAMEPSSPPSSPSPHQPPKKKKQRMLSADHAITQGRTLPRLTSPPVTASSTASHAQSASFAFLSSESIALPPRASTSAMTTASSSVTSPASIHPLDAALQQQQQRRASTAPSSPCLTLSSPSSSRANKPLGIQLPALASITATMNTDPLSLQLAPLKSAGTSPATTPTLMSPRPSASPSATNTSEKSNGRQHAAAVALMHAHYQQAPLRRSSHPFQQSPPHPSPSIARARHHHTHQNLPQHPDYPHPPHYHPPRSNSTGGLLKHHHSPHHHQSANLTGKPQQLQQQQRRSSSSNSSVAPTSHHVLGPGKPAGQFLCEYIIDASSRQRCGQTFRRSYDLSRHQTIHLKNRPFCYCEQCGKKFTRMDALRRHERVQGHTSRHHHHSHHVLQQQQHQKQRDIGHAFAPGRTANASSPSPSPLSTSPSPSVTRHSISSFSPRTPSASTSSSSSSTANTSYATQQARVASFS